ncbi:virulence factor [Rhodobacteraceae bacterium M385]|nr:virulence factor [Rhodobacteraceae bacterium M385]
MPAITHVFWRDIPAQVIVGKGRSGAKMPLPERFEQAIDRAAMKVGAKDDDAYLAGFHRVVVGEVDGDLKEAATAEAAKLDAAYDNDRLKVLINAEGYDPSKPA